MTGFSPEWLALREPADGAARNKDVRATCAQTFAQRDDLSICDLGAGTGASLRALADLLPPRQRWTLVDHDEANLAAARERLSTWADNSAIRESGFTLFRGRHRIVVEPIRRDLAREPHCWPAATDLVTASALFDLASGEWIDRFAAALAADRLPLLATLTFDGTIALDPPHRLDAAVADAFRVHQERDKGFGPAAGSRAADILVAHLANAGYAITTGDSPWRIVSRQQGLRTAFLDGVAMAVEETGRLDPHDIAAWWSAGQTARTITVGHRDVFAVSGQSGR